MPLCIVAGAGPGMGTAIASRFAREGFEVALIAREVARLEAIAREVRSHDVNVSTWTADLCDIASVARAFEGIARDHGSPDVLVYNGARWHEQPAIEMDAASFNSDLALCATGALVCAQHVFQGMKARGSGSILFTGGGLALHPERGAGIASLAAGKAALRALTYALAGELADVGIHVATVTIDGMVVPGTALDPALIAEHYWSLHAEPPGRWRTEHIVAA